MIKIYTDAKLSKQLIYGILFLIAYSLLLPVIMAIIFLILGGVSIGTFKDTDQIAVIYKFLNLVGLLIISFIGVLVPLIKLLINSHKNSKTLGRGDEHIIFYVGFTVFIGTILLYYDDFNGSTENTTSSTVFLFGVTIGFILTLLGTFLLCRLSDRN